MMVSMSPQHEMSLNLSAELQSHGSTSTFISNQNSLNMYSNDVKIILAIANYLAPVRPSLDLMPVISQEMP